MPKQQNESLQDYRDRVIDSKSPSFCGAKWFNATTWLGSGTTTSCHHPPGHKIPLEEVEGNCTAIHNTNHKKAMRKMMQEGKRPAECEYCWKLEDVSPDTISDRVFKSIIYTDAELQEAQDMPWRENVNLKTFEIAFSRQCSMACSYCNASFSSIWADDIIKNGPYINMVSDGAAAFAHDGSYAELYQNEEDNPYIKAFWEWWNSGLSDSLQELRITGGEPLLSSHTWELFDWFEQNRDSPMKFAVNSNLMVAPKAIDDMINKSQNINHFELYTSCEATGVYAEYIRDGLNYDVWLSNVKRVLLESNHSGVHIMMTINGLCLFDITSFFDEMYKLKELTNSKTPTMSLNLLRFPSFQNVLALPAHIKEHLHCEIKTWYEANKDKPLWHEFEKASIERLLDYLVTVDAPHRRTSNPITLWRDFKTFYKEYDKRRNKDLYVFPKILTDWVDSIPDTDSAIQELAEKEGWVLVPDNKNIGDPTEEYK